MNTKIIKLDINKKLYETISAKQGDTESRFLLFHIFDSSLPFDLREKSVRVYGIKPDDTKVFNDLVINDAEKGYCTLELTNQILAIAGLVKLELVIYNGNKKLSSIPFVLNVISSLNSDDAVVSTNEFTALMNGLAALSEYDIYKSNAKQVPGIKEEVSNLSSQLDTKINEVNTNLNNIKTKKITTITPEFFGAKGDGITDDTKAFKDLITYAKNNKSTIELFNKVYCVSEELAFDFVPDVIGNKATIKAISEMQNLISFNDLSFNYKGTLDNITLDGNNLVNNCLYENSGRKRSVNNLIILNSKNIGLNVKQSYENLYSNIRIENCPTGIQVDGTDAHYVNIFIRFATLGLECKKGVNLWENVHAWVNNDTYNNSTFAKINTNQIMTNIYPDSYQTAFEFVNNDANLIINGLYGFYNSDNNIHDSLVFKFNSFTEAKVKISGGYFIDSTGKTNFSDIDNANIKIENSRIVGINNVKSIYVSDIEFTSNYTNIKSKIKKYDDTISILAHFKTTVINYQNNFYNIFNISNLLLRPKTDLMLPCYAYEPNGHISLHTLTIGATSGTVGLKPQSDIQPDSFIYVDVKYITNNDDIITL